MILSSASRLFLLFLLGAFFLLFAFEQSQARMLAPVHVCPKQNLVFKNGQQKRASIRAMFCLHNYARKQAGRKRLGLNNRLNQSANRKSIDILRCSSFSHTACGRKFSFWIENFYPLEGRSYSVGENLAWGSGRFRTPRSLMQGWLRSPGHRRNIVNSTFEEIGFGVRIGKISGVPGAHIWTAHFAYRK